MASETTVPPAIAIVGIGLKLPGGISTTEDFWDMLINKRNGRCRVPDERYVVDGFRGTHNESRTHTVASEYGYFLEDVNLKAFDASFFGMSRVEVESMDPQQRLLLEVVWECMESAGQVDWRGSDIGCFVGAFGEDWLRMSAMDTQTSKLFSLTGSGDFALSNRISYAYDLKGPSLTIRTACSSSLVCLDNACQALYSGRCSAAIVAGSSLILSPDVTLAMTEQGALSPSGVCNTFDAAADGFARGEGVNAILIKRLEDAVRDNDPIRAVIRAVASNCDGKTPNIACPSTDRHDLSQTPYIECHGTGTAVGDPAETSAVANVFSERGIYIGSVKPNVGHSEGASGLTSLIKAVLALEKGVIPPNINFRTPNPKIPFKRGRLQVPVEATPWPQDRHARVSVNSFGIGGTNAHVIIESAASLGMGGIVNRNYHDADVEGGAHGHNAGRANGHANGQANGHANWHMNGHANGHTNGHANGHTNGHTNGLVNELDNGHTTGHQNGHQNGHTNGHTNGDVALSTEHVLPVLVPASAASASSLASRVKALQHYFESRSAPLDQVAYTLGNRRQHQSQRAFFVAGDHGKLLALEQSTRANPSVPHVVFVFTGQGAQWFGMGKELIQKSQYFQSDVRRMDEALRSIDPPPCWSIRDILCSQESEELIQEAEYCQPLCTALQVALVSMLSKCGVAPEAVVGHSSGEIAAAFAAGALTMTEAILCAYYRGLASRIQTQKGSMAAVGLGRDAVFPLLADGAVIACENSANSITLSGDVEAIQKTLERIKSENPAAFTRKLPLDKAYHSHHMNETGRIYEEMLSKTGMSPKEPKIPLYSSLTGRRAGPDTRFDQAYWRQNLESPVLFKAAVQALLSDFDVQQEVLMLEIGPHGALRGPLTQICASRGSQKATYTPTLHRGNDCYVATLTALGRMYAQGCSINFDFLNPTTTILTDVPRYSWDHRLEFWAENRISQAWREKREPHHELLGSRCLECSDIDVSWRNVLQVSDVPWLLDHKLMGDNIFPCAGYLAILGEAIRQTTGSSSYMLRNVVINAALKLHESETIELMTTMRPLRLTDTENSSWFEFSIMSYSRGCWAQHCVAQGKAGQDHTPHGSVPEHHPRWVNRDTWYGRMGKMGLHYGPFFHGLQRISSHTTEDKAVADIETDLFPHLGQYAVHPTMLDACLQLLLVSTARGVSRHLLGLSVPATLGSVSIGPFLASTRLRAEAASRTGPRGVVDGHVMAVSGAGEIVVKVEKVIVKPMDSDSKDDSAHNAQARLEWRPDIDFIDGSQMFRRITSKRDAKLWLERVCALCILRALDGLQSVDIPSGHLAKYATWLQNEKGRMLADEWANLVPEARQWAELEPKTRATVMASVTDEIERVENIATRSFARLALKVSDPSNIRDVFRERIKPVELLMDDGALEVTYGFYNDMVDMENIVALSAHSQPTMRVLEIGAGTGACTEFVLKSLKSEEGTRMYSLYTFTDISSGFFAAAQNKFKQHDGINYKVFDVTRSPAEQGLELGSYDLVVVNNVLHATASLRESLKNVRLLLRPGGRLILVELAQPMMWRCTGQIMGLLPGWWVGEGDNRPDEPFVSPKRWNEELEATGFSGTDVVVLDDDSPYQLNAYIASTAVQPIESVASAADVTLLYAAFKHEFACQLAARLTQDGTRVHWSQIGAKDHVVGRHVISTIDLESPYLHDITKADYDALLAYVTTTKSDMLWLTRAAQIQSLDPRYGLTIGFARTIRTELALRFSTLELQNLDSGAVEATIAVFLKCQRYSASADFDAEPEFVLHNGIVHIGRYRSIRPRDESQVLSSSKGRSRRLVIGQYGLIDSLRWVQDQPPMLEAHEVELDVRAVGLNFRDVLTTMGIIEGWKHNVGIEASAVVTRVGSAVNHVKAGDRVVAAHRSCFSTRIVIPGLHVCRIPDELGFEDAATMPAVYTTVIHCIINMGQLARGQSILIQSACGGVGLAALQICEMIGAEIYVTVGSEDKVRYLMDHHGIPRERIFSSRNTSFLEGIMRATNGRGVDMVLNSLSGELLHAAWQCVAKYGKMMEIGKRDFVGHGKLDLNPFDANRVFHGIDLAAILQDRPHTFHQLLEQCVQLYTEGHIKPIRPVQIFPAREAVEAFRCMQKGRHIGKLVVRMPVGDEARRITTVASLREPALSSEHSYFLAGGLGGLGKAITTWMIERGARHFVFLSRSAGKTVDDQDFLRELASQGCQAVAVAGSVAEPADVQRAVQAATTPIAGVVHMPLVLKDASLPQMEHAAWVDVIGPKVNGAWNIHNALAHSKLDFFVLFSSLSAAWGHPGQANYASANSFLESFAQYRRGLDLPCSVISLGFMENIGYVSRNIKASNQVRNMVCLLQEEELIDALNISINQSWPPSESAEESQGRYCNLGQIMVGMRSTKPLSDPGNHVPWRRDVRMSLCHRQESAAERSTDLQSGHLRVLLDLIASNKSVLGEPETLKVITREIGKALCNFTMSAEENLDVTTSLVSLGIDSLLGIEVRNWWRRTFGADITVIEIMVARTVENLGIMALDSLKERFGYEKE